MLQNLSILTEEFMGFFLSPSTNVRQVWLRYRLQKQKQLSGTAVETEWRKH